MTNDAFLRFVTAGGYEDDELWNLPSTSRRQFTTVDGSSLGPGSWPNSTTLPEGKAQHPVNAISYLEAAAFVKWCNRSAGSRPRIWQLPPEDVWEYAARSETGLLYPWGDAFDVARCNSGEAGIGDTSEVTRFASGASTIGCIDMVGNVWEFVAAADAGSNWCVLRGGSFKNNRFETRSYRRLIRAPVDHRPPDFGFRLAQAMPPIAV